MIILIYTIGGIFMSLQLQWNKNGLLNETSEKERSEKGKNDARTEFDSDYDRIVFSSPFRRLQDKAQVFPLERSDFVRTRLTHSYRGFCNCKIYRNKC